MGIHMWTPLYQMVIKPKRRLYEFAYCTTDKRAPDYLDYLYQSFTPQISHKLNQLILRLCGSSLTVETIIANFQIFKATADGKPTGNQLSIVSIPESDLPLYPNPAPVTLIPNPSILVEKDQPYCIRASGGGYTGYGDMFNWSYDPNYSYPRGTFWMRSIVTSPYWFKQPGALWFEEWGQ